MRPKQVADQSNEENDPNCFQQSIAKIPGKIKSTINGPNKGRIIGPYSTVFDNKPLTICIPKNSTYTSLSWIPFWASIRIPLNIRGGDPLISLGIWELFSMGNHFFPLHNPTSRSRIKMLSGTWPWVIFRRPSLLSRTNYMIAYLIVFHPLSVSNRMTIYAQFLRLKRKKSFSHFHQIVRQGSLLVTGHFFISCWSIIV